MNNFMEFSFYKYMIWNNHKEEIIDKVDNVIVPYIINHSKSKEFIIIVFKEKSLYYEDSRKSVYIFPNWQKAFKYLICSDYRCNKNDYHWYWKAYTINRIDNMMGKTIYYSIDSDTEKENYFKKYNETFTENFIKFHFGTPYSLGYVFFECFNHDTKIYTYI